MEYVRIANLRCIADSNKVEIKPITLLVGANSSGKSSFIRIFPLIKQSLEFRSLGGLVLNEGEVDFGFFNEVLHRSADPEELKIEFGFQMDSVLAGGTSWNATYTEPTNMSCELTYRARAAEPRYGRLSSVVLEVCSGKTTDRIEVAITEDGAISGLRVNDTRTEDLFKSWRVRGGRGMVPRIVLVLSKEAPGDYERRQEPVDARLLKEAAGLFHGRTNAQTRLALFRGLGLASAEGMLSSIQQTGNSSWKASVRKWETTTPLFITIRNLLIARRINEMLEIAANYLSNLASAVRYFAPVRARVERDYLSRDLPVAYVDPTGVNVATMLSSFQGPALIAFRAWMSGHFGFEVFPRSVADGARISLRLREAGSGLEFNLADTGFGFSQMLPFLVEVWSLTEGRQLRGRGPGRMNWYPSRLPMGPLVAIEQPELHLHPAMQGKLADFIVTIAKLSKAANLPVRFMLETHSPILIEKIGQAIEEEKLSMEDVQVILFDLNRKEPKSNTAVIRKVSFNARGVLQDWPFGFLTADAPIV